MTMLHLTEERLLELIDMKADELFAAIEEIKADPIQRNWIDADRIEELEAKLAKLEAAAQKAVGHITGYGEASTARIELRTTLAELTGGKDG